MVKDVYSAKSVRGKILQQANKHGLVIFAGAGISVPSPTSCPTWIGLKSFILECFMDKLLLQNWPKKPFLEAIKSHTSEIALRPETFMWAISMDIGLLNTHKLIEGLDQSIPNFNHDCIATLAKFGVVSTIITTNFDTYIEKSLASYLVPFTSIRSEDEIGSNMATNTNKLLLYKPHGCLSSPPSMQYRLEQIQHLSDNRRNLLTEKLKSVPILVVGYSGNDEDLFPVMTDVLKKSNFPSYICVFPGSPENEPIQQWDIDKYRNITRFFDDPSAVLRELVSKFVPNHESDNWTKNTRKPQPKSSWRDITRTEANRLPHDVITYTLAHLWHLHGNHSCALSLANLAQDICEDTNLSPNPRQSLLFIKELQARIYKELGHPELSEMIQNQRFREALQGVDHHEVVDTLLGQVHAELRNENLETVEKHLNLVGAYLMKQGQVEIHNAGINHMTYLWYYGILRRKQRKPKEADTLFNQAAAIAKSNEDIIHGGRILLDYAYVKCQLDDWETAQQMWGLASGLAEQANDWDTAAKAAKNRGILLSISDKPELGKPELKRAELLFEEAGNRAGAMRAREALAYNSQEMLSAVLALKV